MILGQGDAAPDAPENPGAVVEETRPLQNFHSIIVLNQEHCVVEPLEDLPLGLVRGGDDEDDGVGGGQGVGGA